MMKKKIFWGVFVLGLALSMFVGFAPQGNVQAQTGGCVDAAGASISCTPTAVPPTQDVGSDNNVKPTHTPLPVTNPTNTPTPTLTALPLASGPSEDDLIGTCSQAQGNALDCLGDLQRQCEDGLLVIKVDLYASGGTSYKVYCIPHERVSSLDVPYTSAEESTAPKENWTGACVDGDGLDTCVDLFAGLCDVEGGKLSAWYDDTGAGIHCENQSEAVVVPVSTTEHEVVTVPADNPCAGQAGFKSWLMGITFGVGLVGGSLLAFLVKKMRPISGRVKPSREHILLKNDEGSTESGMEDEKTSYQNIGTVPDEDRTEVNDLMAKFDSVKGNNP